MKTVSNPESAQGEIISQLWGSPWEHSQDREEVEQGQGWDDGSLTHSGNSAKMALVKKQECVYLGYSYPEQSLVVHLETTTLKT